MAWLASVDTLFLNQFGSRFAFGDHLFLRGAFGPHQGGKAGNQDNDDGGSLN